MSAPLRFWLVTAAALVMAGLTGRLGLWQLDRAAQKVALQAAVKARDLQPVLSGAIDWPADESAFATLQHRRVKVSGAWSSGFTVFLDNRPMAGRPGFYVVTPLVLADGRALLVQRGWVPRDALDRTRLPELPTPQGTVEVVGRLAPPPGRLLEFEGGGAGRIRQNLDLGAFARETGLRLLPLSVLQTEPASGADGLRRDWPALDSGVERHRGYAVQWFGLSALIVVLYVWFQLIQPRRRRG
jgi:surfeit locus 1 family protein